MLVAIVRWYGAKAGPKTGIEFFIARKSASGLKTFREVLQPTSKFASDVFSVDCNFDGCLD